MLALLFTVVGAAAASLAPAPMAGPFSSIEKACRAMGYEGYPTSSGIAKPPIVCAKSPLRFAKSTARAYRSVAAIERRFSNGRDARVVHLAIQTVAGWFVSRAGVAAEGSGRCEAEVKIEELAARVLVAGDPARAVLRVGVKTDCSGTGGGDSEYESSWDDRFWLVGGVGPSKAPSATPPILVEQHRREKTTQLNGDAKPKVKQGDAKVALRVQPGKLEVSGSGDGFREAGDPAATASSAVGTHPFVFP